MYAAKLLICNFSNEKILDKQILINLLQFAKFAKFSPSKILYHMVYFRCISRGRGVMNICQAYEREEVALELYLVDSV